MSEEAKELERVLQILALYFVKRDDALCDQSKHAEVRFWQENVRSLIAPDPVNMDDIKAMFLKPNGKPVEVTSAVLDQLRDLKAVRASIAQMKKDEEALEFAICAHVCKAWGADPDAPPADNALLTLNGAQVGTWKRQRGTHRPEHATGCKPHVEAGDREDVIEAGDLESIAQLLGDRLHVSPNKRFDPSGKWLIYCG